MEILKSFLLGAWTFIKGFFTGIWEDPWTLLIIIPTVTWVSFRKRIKKWWHKIRNRSN